ncbi:hypothetical protein [Neisseria dentiae]|uniref:hypothetical protein n=1 Tax=Neisseria dentiae TaxID=194197 RepID=UPI00359FBCE6
MKKMSVRCGHDCAENTGRLKNFQTGLNAHLGWFSNPFYHLNAKEIIYKQSFSLFTHVRMAAFFGLQFRLDGHLGW